jgi:hypothetical protein
MPLAIKIKHAGKTYDLEIDTSAPATVFKEQLYQLTGVPTDKVKVVVKGGMLKVRRSVSYDVSWTEPCLSNRMTRISVNSGSRR